MSADGAVAAIGGIVSFASTLLTGGSVEDALISCAFGMASGALSAALPAAAVFIYAGFAVAESIVIGVKNGDSAGEIVGIVSVILIELSFVSEYFSELLHRINLADNTLICLYS